MWQQTPNNNCRRSAIGVATQSHKTLPVMEQFPGKAKHAGQSTHNTDLIVGPWLLPPCLHNALCFRVSEDSFKESPAPNRKQSFNIPAAFEELLVGPLPIVFEIPAH